MTHESSAQFERDLYALRSAGFAIVPNCIEEPLVAEIERKAFAFEKEVDDYINDGGDVPYKAGWPLKNARCLYAVDDAFERLVLDTKILEYARAYLGDCRLRDCHILINHPDTRNAARGRDADVNWHRDKEWGEDEVIRPSYLHCFVLLTDMTASNGGTLVVPGTHREKEPGYYFLKNDGGARIEGNYYSVYPQRYFPAVAQVCACRGSLVLIDPMVIHAQGINVTTELRSVINATFHRTELRSLFDCQTIAKTGARYQLKQEFIDLLGAGVGLPEKYGPLHRE